MRLVRLPRAYTLDLWLITGLLAMCTLYIAGFARRARRLGAARPTLRRQGLAFSICIITLVVALLSPLDPLSDVLFSAHMVQHELLMLVAAPLLVYAQPLRTYLFALPEQPRERVAHVVRSRWVAGTFRWLTAPLIALVVHGLVRWLWHAPLLFEAALADEWIHGVQHATFFVTATLFWWALLNGRYGRLGYGAALMFVFATSMHTGALGALIALARRPLYGTHAARIRALAGDALADQQLAGLLMWVVAGLMFMVLGLSLTLAWLGESRRRVERSELFAIMRETQRKERVGAASGK
jgi:putative membrane protein